MVRVLTDPLQVVDDDGQILWTPGLNANDVISAKEFEAVGDGITGNMKKVLLSLAMVWMATAAHAFSVPTLFDVTAYGAIRNDDRDDAAAIEAAMQAATSHGGGIVYFPPGTYVAESTINITDDITVRGAGMTSTIIDVNHSGNAFEFESKGVSLEDMRIDMPASSTTGAAIMIEPASHRYKLKNLHATGGDGGTSDWMIRVDAANDGIMENLWLGNEVTDIDCNGILIYNSDPGTNAYNVGDMSMRDVHVKLGTAGTIGIRTQGPDNSIYKINNVSVYDGWIVGTAATTRTAFSIYNSARINVIGTDVEVIATGWDLLGAQNSGSNTDQINIIGVKFLSGTTAYQSTGTVARVFVHGDNVPALTGFTDGDMAFPGALAPISTGGNYDLFMRNQGGTLKVDDGADTGSVQIVVSGNSPQIQPTETNKTFFIGKSTMTTPVAISSQRLRLTETTGACQATGLSDGDLLYADGTSCDPGSGEGFYGRVAGAWVKLH